jgi:hypothetical protein
MKPPSHLLIRQSELHACAPSDSGGLTAPPQRLRTMITSYMDESVDTDKKGVFAVGGFLGRGVPIFELERNWEKLRKRPDIDIGYFKASQCKSGTGQFRKFVADPKNITPMEQARLDAISHEFLNLIVNPVPFDNRSFLCIQGVGVVQQDFYEVINDANARAILGDSPYRLAYDFAMIQCAWAMKELERSIKTDKLKTMDTSPSREYVSFDCDEDEEHSPLAKEAYEHLKTTNPIAAEFMGAFDSGDDKKWESLQAADAAIFEVRRALNLALGLWPGALRKQFNMLADAKAVFLITHTSKDQLLHIVKEHRPGEPYKLDALMDMQVTENIRFNI